MEFLDRQGWVACFGAVLLALITLLSGYDHVFIPGFATAFPLPQQAGIPCIVAALATAIGELKLASNDRLEGAALRATAESDRVRAERDRTREADEAAEERNRAAQEREFAARRAQRQARCTLVQLRYQLDPTAINTGRVRDMIALLEDYGDLG